MSNWPDPAHPGVPLNQERDGWHWVEGATGTPAALEWRASVLKPDIRGWYLHRAQYGVLSAQEMARWTYLGPCLTPKETAAQSARISKLEAALRHLDDLIVDLEMGRMELYQVSDFINAALAGGEDDIK